MMTEQPQIRGFRGHPLWRVGKKIAIDPARRMAVKAVHLKKVPLTWCEGRNWGDALSPWLVQRLSGRSVIHLEGLHHDRFLAIGSILGGANGRAEVWGSGFIRENEPLVGKPRAVHAVRGPLSREKLLKLGVDCPEVYGDPALLLPRFYNPQVEVKYSVGIVPHYIDKDHSWLRKQESNCRVKIIDIESGIQNFVRDVKSCETILSSSLHGLICADSYGIPNAWIQLSQNVIGDGFKFRDYRASIEAEKPKAICITPETQLSNVVSQTKLFDLRINLRELLLACPFISASLRDEVLTSPTETYGLPEQLISTQKLWP